MIHFFVSLAPRHRYILWFYITRSSFALILTLLVNRKMFFEGRNRRNTQPVCSHILNGHLAFKCTYVEHSMRDPIHRHRKKYNYSYTNFTCNFSENLHLHPSLNELPNFCLVLHCCSHLLPP